MCYDLEARPPVPPIHGAAADAGEVTLTSADGTRVAAYAARAAAADAPGIVILPDVRGLHPFFEELALRFAEAGVHAIAIDYFSRTAGTGRRGEGFDYMPHVAQTEPATLTADAAAGVAFLRSPQGGAAERVYTIGFCFAGRLSSLQAAAGHGLAGVISFYGPPVGPSRLGLPAPADEASHFECPVLSITAGPTKGSRPRLGTRTTARSMPRGSSTGLWSTRTRRTPSSTGAPPSTRAPQRTPGARYSASSGRPSRR